MLYSKMQNKTCNCAVIGILNITPDSFSHDGIIHNPQNHQDLIPLALKQVQQFVDAGCAIIDIGGESTRPGHETVSIKTEIERTAPVIRAIRSDFPDIEISIDTSKAEVAKEAIAAGVHMINDVTACAGDPKMGQTIALAKRRLKVVLMHNATNQQAFLQDDKVGGSYIAFDENLSGDSFLNKIIEDMEIAVAYAQGQGIERDTIIIDPGIGFGKTVDQNLTLIANIKAIGNHFGLQTYIGASRKSFIGKVLDHREVQDRVYGSLGVAAITAINGADYVRVHDVAKTLDIVRMVEAIASFTLKEKT